MPLEYALQYKSVFPAALTHKQQPVQKCVDLEGELGLDELPLQKVSMAVRRPFTFNIMVVGESGLGKTTFINTMFQTELYDRPARETIDGRTVSIQPTKFELEEKGIVLHLTVVDTPGFGDQMDRSVGFKPIEDYIDEQFERYHSAESLKPFRSKILDTRVHALLYFISPSGHQLKEMDITFLRQLSVKTNVIPIIAKADTMTSEERANFKTKILQELIKYDVKFYPTVSNELREEFSLIQPHIPFSVIGCDRPITEKGGKSVRGRQYKWGIAEVENPAHCDFIQLRELMLATHMRDLCDTTHDVHYFNYRTAKLRAAGRPESFLKSDEQFEDRLDETKKQFYEEMARKETEMRQAFFVRVKEKEAALRDAEDAFNRKKKEMMSEVEIEMRQLEAEEKEIELAIQRNAANKRVKGK